MRRAGRSEADRFWAKVDKNGPVSDRTASACWLWTGHVAATGYGTFTGDGHRNWKAHRYAYVATLGPVPVGLDLDHLCRVRHCVNPAHLEPVTRRENLHRGQGTPSVTHCPAGHDYLVHGAYTRQGYRRCNECSRLREARKREMAPPKVDGRTLKKRTHCPQGHPYSDENTYRRPNGSILCRVCMRAHAKAGKERAKQLAQDRG